MTDASLIQSLPRTGVAVDVHAFEEHPERTLWLACLGVLQWSVVRFRFSIVLTLTVGAVALGVWLWRRTELRSAPTGLVPTVLLGSVAITWLVPLFSYLRGGALTAALTVLTVVGVRTAGLLAAPTPWRAWPTSR